MRRGELYRVVTPPGDPRARRVYVIVSRQQLLDSSYSTVVCVPVYSAASGLETEVRIGPAEGLKHDSCIRCDEVTSIPRSALRQFVGSLNSDRLQALNQALVRALDLNPIASP